MTTVTSDRSNNVALGLAVIIWVGACIGFWCVTSSETHFAGNVLASYVAFWGLYFLVSDRSRSEKTVRFLITTVTIVLVVSGFELLAITGLVDYRVAFGIHVLGPWHNPAFNADRELIHIHPPYKRAKGTFSGGNFSYHFAVPDARNYPYDLSYDKNGFRNSSGRDTADVAVLGDSFIEGVHVSDSELVTSVLQCRLEATVVNLGITGYGPCHELAVLRRYALPTKPKVVVWTFFEGNDLKNIHDYEEVTSDWRVAVAGRFPFAERSFIKNSFRAVTSRIGKPLPSGHTRSGLVRGADGEFVRTYFLIPGVPLSARDSQALVTTERVLRQAHQLCSSHEVQLVVAYIPTKFRVYHGVATFDLESEVRHWQLNDLPDQVSAMVGRISPDVGYLDLTPHFVAAVQKGIFPYLIDDPHWSAAGHGIAAEAIGENLGARWREHS